MYKELMKSKVALTLPYLSYVSVHVPQLLRSLNKTSRVYTLEGCES